MIQVLKSPPGAKGVDTVAKISAATAAKLRAAGYSFVVRYLGALDAREASVIIGQGLALLAVGYSRRPGWIPSAPEGKADGMLKIEQAEAAGLLPGMTLFCDLEGPGGPNVHDACIDYVNEWARPIQEAGFVAGLYVGFGVPLTSDELYHELAVTAYWHSCSVVPAVAHRGYQMVQLAPPNRTVCQTKVDIDFIQADAKGDTPMWMIEAPAPDISL
jgi:hypothetical protein